MPNLLSATSGKLEAALWRFEPEQVYGPVGEALLKTLRGGSEAGANLARLQARARGSTGAPELDS